MGYRNSGNRLLLTSVIIANIESHRDLLELVSKWVLRNKASIWIFLSWRGTVTPSYCHPPLRRHVIYLYMNLILRSGGSAVFGGISKTADPLDRKITEWIAM